MFFFCNYSDCIDEVNCKTVQQCEFHNYSDCFDEVMCKCSNVNFIIIAIALMKLSTKQCSIVFFIIIEIVLMKLSASVAMYISWL